jgi:hypothetical protein
VDVGSIHNYLSGGIIGDENFMYAKNESIPTIGGVHGEIGDGWNFEIFPGEGYLDLGEVFQVEALEIGVVLEESELFKDLFDSADVFGLFAQFLEGRQEDSHLLLDVGCYLQQFKRLCHVALLFQHLFPALYQSRCTIYMILVISMMRCRVFLILSVKGAEVINSPRASSCCKAKYIRTKTKKEVTVVWEIL